MSSYFETENITTFDGSIVAYVEWRYSKTWVQVLDFFVELFKGQVTSYKKKTIHLEIEVVAMQFDQASSNLQINHLCWLLYPRENEGLHSE